MDRRLFIFLPALTFSSLNAQPLAPKSFEAQIRQNAKNLESDWTFLLVNRNGEWKKIYVSHVDIESLDVVKSDSLLYPYVGKVMIRMGYVHGQQFSTKEGAKADDRNPEWMNDPMNTVMTAFDLLFAPEEKSWRFLSGRSKNSVSAMLGDGDWKTLPPDRLGAGPYGSIVNHLSKPAKGGKSIVKPAKPRINT